MLEEAGQDVVEEEEGGEEQQQQQRVKEEREEAERVMLRRARGTLCGIYSRSDPPPLLSPHYFSTT